MQLRFITGVDQTQIHGNCFPIKDLLKQFACQWDKTLKIWRGPTAKMSELALALQSHGYEVEWANGAPPAVAPTPAIVAPQPPPQLQAIIPFSVGSYYTTCFAHGSNAAVPIRNLGGEPGITPGEYNFANTAFPFVRGELEKHGWKFEDITPPGVPQAYPPPQVHTTSIDPVNVSVDLADGLFILSFRIGIDQMEEIAERLAVIMENREVEI